MPHPMPCSCIAKSNYRLGYAGVTVVTVAALSEGRNLLAVGDKRLENLFRVQVALGEGMFQTNGISTFQFMVYVGKEVQ
jgi:hypothetical protein